ncbi:PhoX family protein [Crenalkalicoccus roseus]|uniref:PhoX family protein n=1 Tax=Crenalkalicoccus roseus TaxID=1485588 RepID=UPI0013050BC6|nr:alkaline phosphatase PhoX [Crenalkalicoccus roseus]
MIRRRQILAASAALAAPALARAQARPPEFGALALPVRQDDTVAPGYRRDVLVRWGDRVTFDAPPWNPRAPSPRAAATQFGWDARVCGIAIPPPAADSIPRGVLAVVHPTVNPAMAWPGGRDRPEVAAAMQGASLLNIEKRDGRWVVVDGGFQSRRLAADTLCRISGPVAVGAESALGVLGPVGGGVTPWGTLLLAEGDPRGWLSRLAPLHPRFTHGEGFGWVLELDPFDPLSLPVKRTALGRFAHGDVAAALASDGRAVVYMTDRRPAGFLYRFVSADLATARDALDAGRLFVARLEGDRLRWLPLPEGGETARDPGASAQRAGGTPFDGPSGLGLDPRRQRLLLACRGSPARPAGHVIEITAADGDDGAETALARLLFAAGDPRDPAARYGGGGLPPGSAIPLNPDTVAVDARGRAWIGTDNGGVVRGQAEGLYVCELDGPRRGVPLPAYGAPRAASIGGAALPPDGEILFAAVRHPGAEPGASFERPATRWPAFEPGVPPRTTLIGLTRLAGGAVGG